MRTVTIRLACGAVACLVASAVLLAPAMANPIPVWNHYKTYMIGDLPIFQIPFELEDQFGDGFYTTIALEQLATPAQKNSEPLADPELHYTWWVIEGDEPGRWVVTENQFGEQGLYVEDARYLLNPALKNATDVPELPIANHFKCYEAAGPPVDVQVTLTTQFGTEDVIVKEPVIFCNPAKKTDKYGNVYDIVEPDNHLVCYRLEPVHFLGIPAIVWDQFLQEEVNLTHSQWLCVPSIKTGVVQAEGPTWGRLKSIYR